MAVVGFVRPSALDLVSPLVLMLWAFFDRVRPDAAARGATFPWTPVRVASSVATDSVGA